MVDALRCARRIVRPAGCVIDFHPTSDRPTVEVGGRVVGHVASDDAPIRHAGAAIALANAVDENLFSVERRERFCFYTYGQSSTEIAHHIRTNWKSGSIDAQTLRRTDGVTEGARRIAPRHRARRGDAAAPAAVTTE
jgi:hypothetical protein